jgi:large subunit ribosomal protein L2
MAVKSFKPTTPALRYKNVADFSVLTPEKEKPKRPRKLIVSKKRTGGRNSRGRITSHHRGGGHRKAYRMVDFLRDKRDVPAKVASIEYDPNRSAYIALLNYADGEKRFIIQPINLNVGDSVLASEEADIKPGNNLMLTSMPVGTIIHNIEVQPGKGGKLTRSAGGFAQLMAKEGKYCHVRMPSGEIRLFHKECRASVGQVSNTDHENITVGKAGRSRWKGIRPNVRGVVMNPVDHPMGGGEGRASGGLPRSPWGQCAKGLKTRKNKRTNRLIVKGRRKGRK